MSRFLCFFFIWNLITKKKYRIQTFRENNAWRRIGFEQYISFTWYWKYVLIVGNRALLLVCSIGKSVLKDIEAHLVRCGRGLNLSHEPMSVEFERFFFELIPKQNGLRFWIEVVPNVYIKASLKGFPSVNLFISPAMLILNAGPCGIHIHV